MLILKIIGAILGGIVGLLLFLLLLALFVPVRYRIHFKYQGSIDVTSSVSWLLHVVHVSILYENKEYKYCLRIFGIPVKQNREEKKQKRKKKKNSNTKYRKKNNGNKKKRDGKEQKHAIVQNQKQTVKREQKKTSNPEPRVERLPNIEREEKIRLPEKKQFIEPKIENNEKEEVQKKVHKWTFHPIRNIQNIWKTVKSFVTNIPKKIKDFIGRIKRLNEKKNRFFSFLREEGTKNSIRKLKKAVFGLLRYISPRKLTGYVRYGTGDPCQTGQLLGLISIARAYLNTKVAIYPDFEDKKFEADLKAHGRMRVFRFLSTGGRCYFDKDVKKFIADVKQLKEEF